MGSFFTNIQVYRPSEAGEAFPEELAAAVRRYLAHGKFREASDEAVEADRKIVIAPPGHEPWISVYDDLFDSQDTNELDRFAGALSRSTRGIALAILVHDSDVLQLRLFRSGRRLELYSNRPDYFGPADEESGSSVLKAAAWRRLLRAGATLADLQSALGRDYVFAEEALPALAGLLRLDHDRCATGYRYLTENPLPPGFSLLRFKAADVPWYRVLAVGPPRLEAWSRSVASCLSPGTEFTIGDSGQNKGGSSMGVAVVVWGEAAESGLVTPQRARVFVFHGAGRGEVDLTEAEAPDGRSIWTAVLPDFEIPPGISDVDWAKRARDLSRLDPAMRALADSLERAATQEEQVSTIWSQGPNAVELFSRLRGPLDHSGDALDAQFRTHVTVQVTGTVNRAGDGALYLGLAPSENFEASASWAYELHAS